MNTATATTTMTRAHQDMLSVLADNHSGESHLGLVLGATADYIAGNLSAQEAAEKHIAVASPAAVTSLARTLSLWSDSEGELDPTDQRFIVNMVTALEEEILDADDEAWGV